MRFPLEWVDGGRIVHVIRKTAIRLYGRSPPIDKY